MCRPGLPKDRQEQGSEQCQREVEEGLLRGHTGANPEVPVHQTGATAINTQQNCQTLMNLCLGYSMDLCLLLVLSQALCGVCCSFLCCRSCHVLNNNKFQGKI